VERNPRERLGNQKKTGDVNQTKKEKKHRRMGEEYHRLGKWEKLKGGSSKKSPYTKKPDTLSIGGKEKKKGAGGETLD